MEAKRRGERPSQDWVQLKNVQLKDGTTIEEVTIEQDTPEQERETINKLLQTEPVIQSSSYPITSVTEVIEKFCAEQESIDKRWTEKSTNEYRATFALFVRIVGNEVFSALQYEQLLDFKTKFLKLPPNINKIKRYRDKSIDNILQMQDVKLMARNTQNKHLNRICSLFKWAVINGFTEKNYASGLPIGKDKNAQDKRDPFANTDLKKLFESPEYHDHNFKHAYQYWLPLIALYTGARLNEISQLHLVDIKLVNDLYVFDFNEGEDDKRLKNINSSRIVPIHSRLIELGLITYFNLLKLQKATRFFPEIKNSRDGYGQIVSRWFARYRKKCGVDDNGKKVFHSFRHTVVNHLKQKQVTKEVIAAIVGHGDESVTFGVYGNKYNPEVLHEYIEMLVFDVEFTEFR